MRKLLAVLALLAVVAVVGIGSQVNAADYAARAVYGVRFLPVATVPLNCSSTGRYCLWLDTSGVLHQYADGAEVAITRQQTTTLTNAQMLALRAAPITVVTAPGAGKWIEFVSAVLIFNHTGNYTTSTDPLQFKYVDGSGQAASESIDESDFLALGGDTIIWAASSSVGGSPVISAAGTLSNAPIVLHNTGNGEYTGGDAANTIKVIVTYRVHATSL